MSVMETSHYKAISGLMRAGRWDDAIGALQVALADQPINARFQAQLGYCYFQLHDFVKAEEAFRAATMIDTRYWQAGRMHAECLDRLGRYEDALLTAEHWQVHEPNDPFLERLVEGLRRQVANNSGAWTKSLVTDWHTVEFTRD